jgi:ubiquinone/menaquinone biosynthesis C-methylase UbiE
MEKREAAKRTAGLEVVDYEFGKEGYQDVARYDAVRYAGPGNEYKQKVMRNAYRRLLGSLEGQRILDVGCGPGRGVIDFAQEAAFAVGNDASFDMLCAARRKNQSNLPCAFTTGHAQHLPFRDGSFDMATALNFLHLFSLPTQRAMVAEMQRVVRPGGTIVLEFDNALNGLGLGLYKRWKRVERGSLPSEIRQVIGNDCRLVKVYGAVLPVVWRVFCRAPRVSVPLERVTYLPVLNRLSHRVYYKLQTPSS